jgi:hypothetical protein
MAEYATRGVGAAGLTTGVIGTALGVLNGGGLGNILGGTMNNNCGCSEDHWVNRYEATQSARIAELETEVKLRDANTFTMGEMGKLRDYVDGRFSRVEHELCDQRVFNTTAINNISCVQGQIAQLMALTKLVVPNTSVCPGWGDVTVSITPATTT